MQAVSAINNELFWRKVQTNYSGKTTFLGLTRKALFNAGKEKPARKHSGCPGDRRAEAAAARLAVLAKPHLSPRPGDPGLEEQVQPAPVVLPRGLHRDEDVLQLQALPARAPGGPEAALPRRLRAASEASAPAARPGPGPRPAARLPARARPRTGHAAPPGARPLRRGPARPGDGRRATAGRGGGLPPRQQEEEEGGGADGQQEAGLAKPQAGAAHAAAPRAPAALRGRLMAPRAGGRRQLRRRAGRRREPGRPPPPRGSGRPRPGGRRAPGGGGGGGPRGRRRGAPGHPRPRWPAGEGQREG